MKKDYSEYQVSEREKYRIYRQGNEDVSFNFFLNYATFYTSSKKVIIEVDSFNEFITMKNEIDEFEKFEAGRRNVHPDILSEEEIVEYEESRIEEIEQNKIDFQKFQSKYDIDNYEIEKFFNEEYEEQGIDKREPLNNVLSGCKIRLSIGEGILDFIYADFETPFRESYSFFFALDELCQKYREENPVKINNTPCPYKVYNRNQEIVENYFEYADTAPNTNKISYASLYSAICPPVFHGNGREKDALAWYYNHLIMLQKEYLDLIEFCFDEDFYPEVLDNRLPAERYFIYKRLHNEPVYSRRREVFDFKLSQMSGNKMPYGMTTDEFVDRLGTEIEVTEQHKYFAEKFNVDIDELKSLIRFPHFVNTNYEFRSVADILDLEFTKMLEQDIRFRKCKRCGKYFIMKGNYNTNYCDRIAEGETRNCQDIMALDNYKKKTADNAAIKIYNKYYKRYSARVKAHTILEDDFKKWKYQAMTKRNECMDGKLTEEDFITWMESCFQNRNRKH